MKLFISYRRKSWGFTQKLVDALREKLDAEIFIDYDSIDQVDFERSILGHLRTSTAVLLIVSEHTFDSARIHRDDDWVRREIRETLTLDIPLVMACVDGLMPPGDLPVDIKAVSGREGVRFLPEYFEPGVERLAQFIARATSIPLKTAVSKSPNSDTTTVSNPLTALEDAEAMLEARQYAQAAELLRRLLATPGLSSAYTRAAQTMQTDANVGIRYSEIADLFTMKRTLALGCEELATFQQEHPAFGDPAKLAAQCPQSAPRRPASETFLPRPFSWIDIPAGKVTLISEEGWEDNYIPTGTQQTFAVPDFTIAKYPTTNRQYAEFIKAGGYQTARWWTDDGWSARGSEGWTEPRYWQDKKWNGAELPVVGVSWYEAVAFCHWFSEATGDTIMLPTEQQWQRAAQGVDNRTYPWGNDWDADRCNNSVGKKWQDNQTSPVTRYEGRGESPFGVVDMSGNVWEWCLTEYHSGDTKLYGTNVRVLRGGSWISAFPDFFRSVFRNGDDPDLRNVSIGFRCALSSK